MLSCSILFLSFAKASHEPENLIESTTINKSFIQVFVNKSFKKDWLKENVDFFARYEDDINLEKIPYSIALLPFILNVFPFVWISGKNYTIDCMDEDTYYSLKKIKKVLQRLYPNTPFLGNLIPKVLVKNRPSVPLVDSSKNVALLYSGGLDSTACSFEHFDKHQLLITAQGQSDLPVSNTNLWDVRKAKFIEYARNYGYTNAFVTCNYSEFFRWLAVKDISPEIVSWRFDTTEGIGLFGVAAPILFTKGYPTLLIASGVTWDFPLPTAANPFLDNNIKAASVFSANHAHFNYNRFDKVKLIVDVVKQKGIKIPFMKVCDAKGQNVFDPINHSGTTNCCRNCTKCLTVINALAALGVDPVPYGFNVTPKEIEERTKTFWEMKKKGIGYWTRWNYCSMQKSIRKLPSVPKTSQWFLSYDFAQGVIPSEGMKTVVDWHKFKDLAPRNIKIPTGKIICPCQEK